MSFIDCKDCVGQYFKVSPYPENWLNEPLQLIRYANDYLTFYTKRGSTEVRFDLTEKDFRVYTIVKI